MHKFILIVSLIFIITIISTRTTKAEWQVDLDVYTPDQKSDTGKASNNLSIGSTITSTEEYDNKLDTIALLNDQVNAYFYHPAYKSNLQKLWRDFRESALPKEWEFEVQSSKIDNPINIKWTIGTTDNLHFVLVDKDSGNEIDMASSTEYAYNASSTTPKKFLLKVSDNNSSTPVNNNVVSGGGGGAAGTKGGGCGRIKNINNDNDPRNSRGNLALNMIILFIPLLFPFKRYVRWASA